MGEGRRQVVVLQRLAERHRQDAKAVGGLQRGGRAVGFPAISTDAAMVPFLSASNASFWPIFTSVALMPSRENMSRVESCVPLPTSLKLTVLPASSGQA